MLTFAAAPQWRCLCYDVRTPDGAVATTLTAATVTRWHFRMLQEAGESSVFQPLAGRKNTRARRRQWLQELLLAALPLHERVTRDMVADVMSHAFRAGLTGDMHDEQVQ